ncbi:hypothetical protein CQA01_44600 [Cyclobacterium qasimii]|uniref:Uncharacterized protein n=1 Tax=Cyclobacterium qasimii TaxID=1350429 RepID=A0A512CIA7_9BACT|nr:hypothetical protein CQA01_44600 [Cyclobacterium qasimii]
MQKGIFTGEILNYRPYEKIDNLGMLIVFPIQFCSRIFRKGSRATKVSGRDCRGSNATGIFLQVP